MTRKSSTVVPPRVEYRLTSLGQEAAERVRELADWIELGMPRITEFKDIRSG